MTLQCGTIIDCWRSKTDAGFKEGKIKPDREGGAILDFIRCPTLFKKGERVFFETGTIRAVGGFKGVAKKVQRLLD